MFAHLNVHSYYSLGWGIISPEAICEAVRAQGGHHVAITDTNAVYGLIRFMEAAQYNGLHPIAGSEVSSSDEKTHVTLLVRNYEGYSNLCHIITERHHNVGFDLAATIKQRHTGLVVMTDDILVLSGLKGKVEYLYAELIYHLPTRWKVLDWARHNGVKSVAVARSFWTDPADASLHKLLRAIHLNTTLSRIKEGDCISTKAVLPTENILRETFAMCPDAVDRTIEIAELCQWKPNFGTVYPEVEPGMNGSAIRVLRRLAEDGAVRRYGSITHKVRDRLEYELELIEQKGFAPVFLVVHDIVRKAPITCGRGSAAASIISYCLFITHVDPLRHNLFFGRFISAGRIDPPDIDIDFPWDMRDDVLDYIFEKYGKDSSAMVSNHVTFKQRAAVHEIAKVYGIPECDIMDITSHMSHSFYDSEEQITEHPALQSHGFPDPWPEILYLADKLRGIPRNLSVHCGGVVITPGKTANWVPTQTSRKGPRILQWEKDQTEDSGLVKIDILGNRSLAVIRDSLQMVNRNYGTEFNYATLNPLDDALAQTMLSRGESMGVFYIESPATRLLQKKAGFGDFEHVIIHSSLVRPAANRFTETYLRRLKGEPWDVLHPLLEDVLTETYGIMVYQEQVSQVAVAIAGFTDTEGDELRRILSKKHKQKRLEDLRQKFYSGADERDVPIKIVDELWAMILSFSGYSFCKPHSASYALVSFKSAFLRVHYPAEFMAAVISNQGGFYNTAAYISEAKRMGIKIFPPDVNKSEIRYIAKDRWMLVGLQQIKGLTASSIEKIIEVRNQGGHFIDFYSFINRTRLKPNEYRTLIRAGCCDCIAHGLTRPQMLFIANQMTTKLPKDGQSELLDTKPAVVPYLPEFDMKEHLQDQYLALGFFTDYHPLDFYEREIQRIQHITAAELDKHVGHLVEVIGMLVTSKTVMTNTESVGLTIMRISDPSKPSQQMCFITFEDRTGLIESVMFPETFRRFRHWIHRDRPYRIFGRVEESFGAITLTVERIRLL